MIIYLVFLCEEILTTLYTDLFHIPFFFISLHYFIMIITSKNIFLYKMFHVKKKNQEHSLTFY